LDINNKSTSILLVEQNARLALRLAHRGYVLETGNLALEGKCEDFVTDAHVKKAYLGQQ
jgi:branched-chain amino acid transport system ATP-binding protein